MTAVETCTVKEHEIWEYFPVSHRIILLFVVVVVVVIDVSPASISLGEALALVSTTRFFLNILCIC